MVMLEAYIAGSKPYLLMDLWRYLDPPNLNIITVSPITVPEKVLGSLGIVMLHQFRCAHLPARPAGGALPWSTLA